MKRFAYTSPNFPYIQSIGIDNKLMDPSSGIPDEPIAADDNIMAAARYTESIDNIIIEDVMVSIDAVVVDDGESIEDLALWQMDDDDDEVYK